MITFSQNLRAWYRKYKRDLPWRNTTDAYLIWLSEIILQQTRVEQGMPYFYQFSEKYPNIKSFASASEDDILRLWQGLGYYSRGRNMLKTARKVMEEFNGEFPQSYNDLITLTGIGEYTAAAISSFSANEAKAVVDGNVYRLLARHFGIDTPINSGAGKKQFQEIANELIDHDQAAEHNQAMIEFGALQCKPKNPACEYCPFIGSCYAYQHKKVHLLPVKLKKLKIKERYFYFFLIVKDSQVLLKRRDNNDIWAGLHDLPSVEFMQATDFKEVLAHVESKFWINEDTIIHSVSEEVKHVLTHQRLYAKFVHLDHVHEEELIRQGFFWVRTEDLHLYGQPKLIFDFLKNFLN